MLPYTYNLNDDPDRKGLASHNSKVFETHFPAENIPLGLNMLDMHGGPNYRIHSYFKGAEPVDDKYGVKPVDDKHQTFNTTVHLDTWYDTTLVSAGCTWLDVPKWGSQFQFGRQNATTDLTHRGQPESIDIKFDRPHEQAPKVVVWFHSLNVTIGSSVKAYAANATTTGFTLRLDPRGSVGDIHECGVSWVAVPQNWPNTTAGSFELSYNGGHILESKANITFDKPFERAPRVLVALNDFQASNSDGLQIEVKAENITEQGMTLSVKSWDNCSIRKCSVDYIAIVD
ncbi:H-type lectin domain protein, partial [Rhizoctonia solani AG-3 Rhs1AP]